VGVESGEDAPAPRDDPPPPVLGPRRRIALAAFFCVLYAGSFIARGDVAAGLVGGLLGGVLVYLILKEADARRRRRWQATRPGPKP
jgi:hypothetical protein